MLSPRSKRRAKRGGNKTLKFDAEEKKNINMLALLGPKKHRNHKDKANKSIE
jgi:hypothetical protein